MGSGKTTTACELAKLRGIKQTDLDELLQDFSKKSINQIFSEDGEAAFRELEKTILKRVITGKNQVIATGGGIVLSPENIQQMRGSGTVIYLKTSFPALWQRVKNSKERPLLKSKSPEALFHSIFDERTPLYESASHHCVITDSKTPKQVAIEINETFFK